MGHADSEILDVIGQLHEGVVDDAIWKRGLADLCGLLQAPSLLIGSTSRDGRRVDFEFGHGANEQFISLLTGPLADPSHNPWLSLAGRHPLRRTATVDDMGGQQFLESTRIWQDLYARFGLGDSVGAALERQPEFSHVLITGRFAGQPAFRPADRKMLEMMLPHLARAWRVKRTLAEMETLNGTLKFVLDRLERAVVVSGPNGEVRFANRAADRLLSRGDVLDASRGRIRAARSHHSAALLSLIERTSRTGVGAGTDAVDAVSLTSINDHPSLAIVAEPLAPAHSERLGHSAAPGAVLFISDSEAGTRPSSDRIQHVYGLTAAEARTTALLVQGHDISSVAEELGVSRNTAKYHLKAVFGKVGVSRQTQLVRRVLADVGGLAEPEKMLLSLHAP